jgi:hypothetical protein
MTGKSKAVLKNVLKNITNQNIKIKIMAYLCIITKDMKH